MIILHNRACGPIYIKRKKDMGKKLKVAVLRETKTPPDSRVTVTPSLVGELTDSFPEVELFIQKSDIRGFADEEYREAGVIPIEDVSHCDIMLGVKEVDIPLLIPGKTYLFFSHTAKMQPYNRELLQEVIRKKIRLVDHEYLTDKNNVRLVAFGRWAGIVGAYNGLRAWGKRFGSFELTPAHKCHDMEDMKSHLSALDLAPVKILVTGGGRVAMGAMETFAGLAIKEVNEKDFLEKDFDEPVICRIDPGSYVRRKDGGDFDLNHFFAEPAEYESAFLPFSKVTDLFVPCHFWDPASPVFLTPSQMAENDMSIRVISDVSCDIKEPIPSTLRASTIADPFYGYDPITGKECPAWDEDAVTVVAVDNLPGELPRDASEDFGRLLLDRVYPSLFGEDGDGIIERATIARDGKLTERYSYLQDYLDGNE